MHPQDSSRQRRWGFGSPRTAVEPSAAALACSLGAQGLDRPARDEAIGFRDRAVGSKQPRRPGGGDVEPSVQNVKVDRHCVSRRDDSIARSRRFALSHFVDAEAALLGVDVVGLGDLALLQLFFEAAFFFLNWFGWLVEK